MAIDQLTASMRPRMFHAGGRRAELLLFLLFFGSYAALIAWFKFVDVYHTQFSSTGTLILLHNLFRMLFVFYLFWIVQSVGAACLRLLRKSELAALGTLEYLALTFFAGAGVWHVALLAVGYLRLLNVPAMVILTVPVVALSFREVRLAAAGFRALHGTKFLQTSNLFKVACISLCLVWCALLVIKGLYPRGSDDYYSQYFPAYQAVLEHGNVWPNEVWLLYFYAKGAGLFFLGMLLTDPLAPQLVTFCFMSVAGLAIFLFVGKIAPHTIWPVIAVLLLFALFAFAPGWGEFHKPHDLNAALVIAILWMMAIALEDPTGTEWVWAAGAASAMAAAVVISVNIAVYLGAVFGTLALAYFSMGDRRRGSVCLAFAAFAGVLLACILVINFTTSGLLNAGDPSFLYYWQFANVEKLDQWGALPMVLWLHRFSIMQASDMSLVTSLKFLIKSLRLDLLWPLFFGGLAVSVFSAYQQYRSGKSIKHFKSPAACILTAAILVFVPMTLIAGRTWPSSFFRVSSFVVPVVIVAAIAMWRSPIRSRQNAFFKAVFKRRLTPIVILALCAAMIAGRARLDRDIRQLGAGPLSYAAGLVSIDDSYAPQPRSGPQAPRGGIERGARGAYAVVGPHTPMWSMNVFSYCMLPDCKMMFFWPFIMTRSWDKVIWGTPVEGRDVLHAAGLNYFLFSTELPIFGPLPLSPLFSPDNIAQHLGVRWTDGRTTMLTWLGPDTKTLDAAWLAEYRQALTASTFLQRFPNAEFKAIFDRLNSTPHPWRPFELRWQRL
jgi:hypothetical protein